MPVCCRGRPGHRKETEVMAREFEFSILAKLEDEASKGLESIRERIESVQDQVKRGLTGRRGLLGGFAGIGRRTRPGGIGGFVSGAMQNVTKALMAPVRGLNRLLGLIPAVGSAFSALGGTAVNALQGVLGILSNIAGLLTNVIVKSLSKATQLFGRLLGQAAKWGGIGLAAAGAGTLLSVRHAGNVQDAWNKVLAIMDLGPKKAQQFFTRLRDEAIRTGKSLRETINGFYQIASAGFKQPAKAFELLRVSIEGAVGGVADFPTVVKAVTKTMENFERGVKGARDTMDSLLRTVDVGQIELPQIAAVIGDVGNAADAAGAGLEQTLSALGIMAKGGKVPEMATRLKSFFLTLARPTNQTREAMQKLKKAGMDMSAEFLRSKGLVRYLERLHRVRREAPRLYQQLFPERRAFLGAKAMTDKLEDIEEAIERIGGASGKTRSNFERMMDSVNARAGQAKRVVLDLALSFGRPIADRLTELAEKIRDSGAGMEWFRKQARWAGKQVAKALDWAIKKGEKLHDTLQGREWSLSKLKKALEEIPGLIEKAVQAAWQKVTALWPTVRDTVAGWIQELVDMFQEQFRGIFRDWAQGLRRSAAKGMQQVIKDSEQWHDLTPDKGVLYDIRHNPLEAPLYALYEASRHMAGKLGPVRTAQMQAYKGMMKAAGLLEGMAGRPEGAGGGKQEPPERRETEGGYEIIPREGYPTQRQRSAAQQESETLLEAWKNFLNTLAPKKAEEAGAEQAREDKEAADAGGMTEGERRKALKEKGAWSYVKQTRAHIERMRGMAKLYEEQGQKARAESLQQEVKGLRKWLGELLENMLSDQRNTEHEVKQLKRKVRKLSISRAG